MGNCYFCMKDHSIEPKPSGIDKEKILNGTEQKVMDFSEIDKKAANKSGNLITDKNNKNWNEDETEKLEHELEKEILKKQVTNANEIDTKMMEELDDVLDDSLEESNDMSVDEEEMEDIEMDKDGNTEKHRRNSNLFRYKSQKSWDNADLEQQEDDLQKQMDLLRQQSEQQASNAN